MPVRAILFDKDGTLVDVLRTLPPAFARVVRDLAEGDADRLSRLADAAGLDLVSTRLTRESPVVAGSPAELAVLFGPILGVPADASLVQRINALAMRATAQHLVAAPGASTVVGWLKAQGYRVGVSTNTAASHAREELDRLDLLRHLDFLAGFNSGFGAKPEPGHVLAFSRAVDVPAAEIACVGDSRYDLEAARAAGAVPIAVLGGTETIDTLGPLAAHVIGSLEDLPPLLDQIG